MIHFSPLPLKKPRTVAKRETSGRSQPEKLSGVTGSTLLQGGHPGKTAPLSKRAAFQTTQWNLVWQASAGTAEAGEALNQLCRNYWHPLYHYLRHHGHSKHDAEDLTQQFLMEFLGRGGLARAHPRLGSFRSFLLGSLRNFLSHQRERAGALKRGGGKPDLPLEAVGEKKVSGLPTAHSPEASFDREWGLVVLQRAKQRLEGEYIAAGKRNRFERLVEYLPGGEPVLSQAELADSLGTTVSAIKSETFRLRQRFGQYLRAEIAETVSRPSEIDVEIRHFLGLFTNGHG